MAPILRTSMFNKLKPLLQQLYTKADFSTIRPQHPHVKTSLQKPSMDLTQSIRNQTHVSTTLASQLLSKKFPNSNVVFSPLSIHVVLSILVAGSKGQTHNQLLGFLKANTTDEINSLYEQIASLIMADSNQNGGPVLSFANGLWVDETLSLKPSFKQVVDNIYKAACEQVDFKTKADQVVDDVNLWAAKQTNGLIKNVISAIKKDTWLIFANAIYFKGKWSEEFVKSRTKKFDFHLLDGNKVLVPFMTSNKDQFVREFNNFKVLGLPYFKGQDKHKFTMYFFLPNEKDGLQTLVENISSTSDFLECHIPRKRVEVGQFRIPKFKISFMFEASGMLQESGLVLPFVEGNVLTEMVDSPDGQSVYVSGIHQKSFVEVNEEGTEAAAVTVMVMKGTCSRLRASKPAKIDFVADHPFLFVIREDVTGVVLFMGQVINPHVG